MTPYQEYPQIANANLAPLQPYQQYAQQNTLPNNQYQVQNFDQSGYPQTGLAGSEQALQGGLAGALTGLQYGTGQAQGALNQGFNTAQMYGVGALNALGQANQASQGYISQGLGDINTSIDSGVSALSQFIPQGVNAYNMQGNFLGTNGADAKSQAFSGYTEGPEQAYLREQGQRAVLQNARAAGGVGGNVLKELQRQGIGMAAQDYGNYFNRLAGMSGQGLSAASGVGSLRGQQAGLQGNLASLGASNASQLGSSQANILNSLGGMGYDLGTNTASLLGGAGNRAADYAYNTGNSLSTGRTNAGNQIAALQGQEGVDISNMLGSSASNIAQLLAGTGDSINSQQANLAALLANISTGTGSSAGNQTSVAQFQQTPNYLAQLGQITGAASSAQEAYDRYRQQQQNNNYYDYNMNYGGNYA